MYRNTRDDWEATMTYLEAVTEVDRIMGGVHTLPDDCVHMVSAMMFQLVDRIYEDKDEMPNGKRRHRLEPPGHASIEDELWKLTPAQSAQVDEIIALVLAEKRNRGE